MQGKTNQRFYVGYSPKNVRDYRIFKIPCDASIDFSTREADFYFNISRLTKNGAPYRLNIAPEALISSGYDLQFKGFKISSGRNRKEVKNSLKNIARERGKNLIRRLLSEGIIK